MQTQIHSGTSPSFRTPAQHDPALQEEGLLIRELAHRTANDWMSAISTLSNAARHSQSHDVKTVLADLSTKLYAQTELMRALQMPEYDGPVDAAEYLGHLCLAISRSRLEERGIRLVFAADPLTMEAGRCWRLGMIVSELVTNSARHAFHERHVHGGGIIRVDLRRKGAVAGCLISDNGSAARQVRAGHGTMIVRELVASVGGTIDQTFGPNGSISKLCFRV